MWGDRPYVTATQKEFGGATAPGGVKAKGLKWSCLPSGVPSTQSSEISLKVVQLDNKLPLYNYLYLWNQPLS